MKVWPKNDAMRKILKHPSNRMSFPNEGPLDWPDDTFTARRIADGDVTIMELKKVSPAVDTKQGDK
jgi:hypothetical protein